jgi:hypothetical protein
MTRFYGWYANRPVACARRRRRPAPRGRRRSSPPDRWPRPRHPDGGQPCCSRSSRSTRSRGPRRAAEPPIDPRPHEPGPVTYPAPVRRGPDHPMRTAPGVPLPSGDVWRARRPTAASPWAPPALATPADRRWCGAHGARTRGRARRRLSRGAGEVGDRAVRSTNCRPTPIEVPIPSRADTGYAQRHRATGGPIARGREIFRVEANVSQCVGGQELSGSLAKRVG